MWWLTVWNGIENDGQRTEGSLSGALNSEAKEQSTVAHI
jgi:hypothetical protein